MVKAGYIFMKKTLISIVFLLICAAVIFFIGWVQFLVPAGSYGIMISKTGGLYPQPIESGVFIWRWERLLPTNTQLRIFDLTPQTITETVEGMLPSAELYQHVLAKKTDFSYSVTLEISLRVPKDKLVTLIHDKDFANQETLNKWIQNQSTRIASNAADSLIQQSFAASDRGQLFTLQSVNMEDLRAVLNNKEQYLEITDITVKTGKIPDTALYRLAQTLSTEQQTNNNTTEDKVSASAATEETQTQL